jgi:hypothetical protein
MTAISNPTYYHKVQEHSLPIFNRIIENLEALETEKII